MNHPRTISEVTGFTPQVGHLVAMLQIARIKTLSIIQHLTVEDLDFQLDDKSNSIGTLLKHMAALEYWFQVITFDNRALTEQELALWRGALPDQLSLRLISGNDLTYYIQTLQTVRAKTINQLLTKEDDWLYIKTESGSNNYYKWYHIMEDEISHRGQIIWIKKRLTSTRKN